MRILPRAGNGANHLGFVNRICEEIGSPPDSLVLPVRWIAGGTPNVRLTVVPSFSMKAAHTLDVNWGPWLLTSLKREPIFI